MKIASKFRSTNLVWVAVFLLILLIGNGCGGGGGDGSGNGGSGKGSHFLIAGYFGDQWYGSTLGNWIEVLGIVSSYNSRGVAFGNGRYVWVGDSGVGSYASAYSASDLNDLNFTLSNFGNFTYIYEVVFGNGSFVAIGHHSTLGAHAWVSTDGVNWTMNSVLSGGYGSIFKIAFGNGRFVAECTPEISPFPGDDICHSTDGINWSNVMLVDVNTISDVSFGDSTFIAAGSTMTGTGDQSVWTSTDGITWSGPSDLGSSGGVFGAAFGNGIWLLVGSNAGVGQTFVSSDGVSWTGNTIGGPVMRDVVFADGQFVAVGDDASVKASVDGINWINYDIPGGGARLNAIAFQP